MPETKMGICDVHKLNWNDSTTRKVEYCGFCKAWICEECIHNYDARWNAFVKSKGLSMRQFISGLENYVRKH